MSLPDCIGLIGVILTLIAYFFLQIDLMSQDGVSFSLLNLIGSVLILFSLYYVWNTAAASMEAAWLLISCYGLIKSLHLRRKKIM